MVFSRSINIPIGLIYSTVRSARAQYGGAQVICADWRLIVVRHEIKWFSCADKKRDAGHYVESDKLWSGCSWRGQGWERVEICPCYARIIIIWGRRRRRRRRPTWNETALASRVARTTTNGWMTLLDMRPGPNGALAGIHLAWQSPLSRSHCCLSSHADIL